MEINYLSGIKAGDKIDLSRFTKDKERKDKEKIFHPEIHLENLKKKLAGLANEVNGEFGEFLNTEGQISLVGPDATADAAFAAQQEKVFADALGKDIEHWRHDKDLNPASLTEMTLTLILHNFLKEDFIVARASNYDDYNHGVDQVIIDKKSGAVVCGFDEVIAHNSDGSVPKKDIKLRNKAENGARLKYGATVQDGRLERRSLRNIPAFYLTLTKEDLAGVLNVLEKSGSGMSPEEIKIFNKLVESLDQQFLATEQTAPNQELAVNLHKFKESLEKIKNKNQSALELAA